MPGEPVGCRMSHRDSTERLGATATSGNADENPVTNCIDSLNEVSPKQSSSRSHRDWYPYYAGFTERFVEAVIEQYFGNATNVLDPWSGSGTTTVTCLRRDLSSHGLDINPVATVISRARLNPLAERPKLLELGTQIVQHGAAGASCEGGGELLQKWMTPASARRVNRFRHAIHEVLEEPLTARPQSGDLRADGLSAPACFFYSALFGSVRALLSRFGTTNPMWLKPPHSRMNRIRPSSDAIGRGMVKMMAYLAPRLTLATGQVPADASPFMTADASRTGFPTSSFDAVLTSPPYATRIDYVKGTLPELAVLGADHTYIQELRGMATGSPTVDGPRSSAATVRSPYGRNVLAAIEHHESKGSSTYYLPWMTNYLTSLQDGLLEIHRTVRGNGIIGLVLQDSYYKEVHIDLQRVVTEILLELNWPEPSRHDYPARSRRRRSSSERKEGAAKATTEETLLVFGTPRTNPGRGAA